MTIQLLSHGETVRMEQLEILAQPMGNFINLRPHYEAGGPTVKSICTLSVIYKIDYSSAVLVKDLTGIEEGNNDWHDKETQFLNVEKLILLGTIIFFNQDWLGLGNCLNSVRESHMVPYVLTPVPKIQEFLKNITALTEEELEAQSRIVIIFSFYN